ncbi:unnamed protein product [Hermetia illucens]|uniref:Ig-like domain-containing protein n=1 Tax=Hermetia illucens TaxID=343691 RepID=A0A7R8Z0T3_HERIL|nr:unnamed protein product [Hermetia illucens]
MWKLLLLFGLWTSIVVRDFSIAVMITNLKVPTTYTLEDIKNPDPLILDCEYEVDSTETGFVLKWLLNGVQIYQWIPEHKPFPLGSMKSRIDTSFSLSTDFHHRHRAISIIKPEWNMTGEYTCSVQTFQSSDRKSSYLQIIVPETDFQLTAKVDFAANDVIIVCSVQNVFPEPVLTILFNNDQPVHAIKNLKKMPNHLYSGNVTVELPRSQIESPTPINCVLTLPGSNYTKRRETIFYDQGLTTTVEPCEEEISSAISRLEGDGLREESPN